MRDDVTKRRLTWRSTLAATMAGCAVLAAAAGTQAHEKHWKHHGPYFVPPGHVYYAAPVVYAPRPVMVYPAPVYYEPVYYPPPAPGLNLNFNIPLR